MFYLGLVSPHVLEARCYQVFSGSYGDQITVPGFVIVPGRKGKGHGVRTDVCSCPSAGQLSQPPRSVVSMESLAFPPPRGWSSVCFCQQVWPRGHPWAPQVARRVGRFPKEVQSCLQEVRTVEQGLSFPVPSENTCFFTDRFQDH